MLRELLPTRRPPAPPATDDRFQRVFAASPAGMLVTAVGDDTALEVNEALASMLGTTRDALIGTAGALAGADPEDLARFRAGVSGLEAGLVDVLRCELRLLRADGWSIHVAAAASLLPAGAHGPASVLTQFVEIGARHLSEARLLHLIDHDELTGLFNRPRFDAELARELELSAVQGSRGAVCLLELDGLAELAEAHGIPAAEDAMIRAAEVLTERLRSSDVVARIGDGAFAILLRRVDGPQAEALARELVPVVGDALAPSVPAGLPPGASIGIGLFDGAREATCAGQLLAEADDALYEAKARGGGVLVANYRPLLAAAA